MSKSWVLRVGRLFGALFVSAAMFGAPVSALTAASPAHAALGDGEIADEVAAEAQAEVDGHIVEKPGIKVILATLVNFLIFAFIVAKLGGPAANKAMAARREALLAEIEEASRLHREAQEQLDIYMAKLNAFDQEREALLDEFRSVGERERDKLVADAEVEAKRIIEDAKQRGEREAAAAERSIETQLLDRAMSYATADIERQVNPMVHNRLVDRSIESFKSLKAS